MVRYHPTMYQLKENALRLFKIGVESVKPSTLIGNRVAVVGTKEKCIVKVSDQEYKVTNKCYVVGFGKAVYGMATALEPILGPYLECGIISVPFGTQKGLTKAQPRIGSKFQVFEGAKNNIPDEDSKRAAEAIFNLVKPLGEGSLLLVLISGGGSALLPLPIPEITFVEKTKLVNLLASKGANIVEMNCVRKRLSTVKGGGLAITAHPCQVVALVLSDVIDDPLDSIASGPTCPNTDEPDAALKVIVKYGLQDTISKQLRSCLERKFAEIKVPIVECSKELKHFAHVNNIILGNNKTALDAMFADAINLGFYPTIMSRRLHGIARNLGCYFALMTLRICGSLANRGETIKLGPPSDALGYTVPGEDNITSDFLEMVKKCKAKKQPICLLFAGETTVNITGSGIGGRNQEIPLSFAIQLRKYMEEDPKSPLKDFDICLLSAGTDGIDGPTTAAGAFGYHQQAIDAANQKLDPQAYLDNNDSNTYFCKLNGGQDLIITGHTGTNVMDLQILLIQPKAFLKSSL